MIKISPHVPSSLFGLLPVPQPPGFLGCLIHEVHKAAIVELSKSGVFAKIVLAKFVSNSVGFNVATSDVLSHSEDTSGPAIVVSSIEHSEWGVLDSDGVPGSRCGLIIADTEDREGLGAWLIADEGVAVVAGEASCPIVLIGGEHGGLEGEAPVQRLGSSWNPLYQGQGRLSGDQSRRPQHEQSQLQASHLQNNQMQKITAD